MDDPSHPTSHFFLSENRLETNRSRRFFLYAKAPDQSAEGHVQARENVRY